MTSRSNLVLFCRINDCCGNDRLADACCYCEEHSDEAIAIYDLDDVLSFHTVKFFILLSLNGMVDGHTINSNSSS